MTTTSPADRPPDSPAEQAGARAGKDDAGKDGATPVRRLQTRQRSAVWAALAGAADFQSAQQLHARLRAGGDGVGLATVYRTLQGLAEDGEVDVLRAPDGEAMYRRCSTGHHHHLSCRRCHRTVEVDSVAVERWARRIGEENGFADVEHVVEVFGICTDCAHPTPR